MITFILKLLIMKTTNIKNYAVSIAKPDDKDTYMRYLNEVSKYKPLSREDELVLIKRIKETNDERDIDKLCKHNLRFVISIAKRYSTVLGNSKITLEDLISEGNLGMCLAIKRFDYSTGNKFISYAVWWIKQMILDHISKHHKNIRLPINIISMIKKMKTRENELEQKLGYQVSTTELFENLHAEDFFETAKTSFYVDEIFKMSNGEQSLEAKFGSNENSTLGDFLQDDNEGPDESLITKERYKILNEMVATLPPHIIDYFNDYFGLDGRPVLMLKDIAIKHDRSVSRIKQNIDKYLRKLKIYNKGKKQYFFPAPNYVNVVRKIEPKIEPKIFHSSLIDYVPQTIAQRKAEKVLRNSIKKNPKSVS